MNYGRRPQFFRKWKTTSISFKWKTTWEKNIEIVQPETFQIKTMVVAPVQVT
jgi:hypothetical protein